jgi:hypothetical protein
MMPFEVYLTTLTNVLNQMGGSAVTDAADDANKVNWIAAASSVIQAECHRSFEPYRATVLYDATGEGVSPTSLDLEAGHWLLDLKTLTNGDSSVIASTSYILRGRGYPKYRIELLSGTTWTYDTDPQSALSLDAIWGYHEDYDHAWIVTGDTVQDNPLSDSATSLTVTDADGTDARFRTRFGVGMLLKIEDEYLRVRAVNTVTNTLTVTRGVNGTTAAAHVVTTPIYSWAVAPDVEQACVQLVAWMERQPGSPGEVIQVMMNQTVIKSDAIPSFVTTVLGKYSFLRVR